MVFKQTGFRLALLALLAVAMLGLPVAVAAQAGNGITSPAADATVTGKVDVKGNAGGPNFSKWQLDLLPGGNPNAAIFLALGLQPGAIAYTLDTTTLPDGSHALRLRSVRADGNYDEYTRPFTITNQAKTAPAAAAQGAAKPAATAAAAPAVAAAAAGAQAVNGITGPAANASVRGNVDVKGNAGGPNFSKWQLDLLPGGDPNAAIFLALGLQPGAIAYTLDTTKWPDGAQALRLRNVRADGNYDEFTRPFTITNQAKTAPAAAAITPTAVSSIQGIVWQWTSVTNQTTKKTDTVPNPANYTITFKSDGTLTGKADCNAFSGTYSQQNGFSIKLGPSTMAACGPASLDQQYLQLLSNIAAGGPDGAGHLALETAGGEQRMLFTNGGPAPK